MPLTNDQLELLQPDERAMWERAHRYVTAPTDDARTLLLDRLVESRQRELAMAQEIVRRGHAFWCAYVDGGNMCNCQHDLAVQRVAELGGGQG